MHDRVARRSALSVVSHFSMLRLLLACVLAVLTRTAPYAFADGANTYLLLDRRNIISRRNVKLVLGTVVKAAENPLLTEQQPWELQFNNSERSPIPTLSAWYFVHVPGRQSF
eukprot:SAG31_NODE_960_length_10753_cov_7.843064_8_plen_112_part_00